MLPWDRMRWAVLVTMCACGRLGFDAGGSALDGGGDDGGVIPDADRRPYGGFANPVNPGLGGFADPQFSADGTEIWATVETTDYADPLMNGTGEYNLFHSASVNGAFQPMQLQPLPLNSVELEVEPALTSDGNTLVFLSQRNGERELFQTQRVNKAAPWSVPVLVFSLRSQQSYVGSFDMLPDGKTIYYEREFATGDVWTAKRSSLTDMFVTSAHVGAMEMNFPSVSPDERLMVGNVIPTIPGDRGMRWAWRDSTSDPWTIEPAAVVLPGGVAGCAPAELGDPDISPDGNHMVVSCVELVIYSR